MDRIRSCEITDHRVYLNRRAFIAAAFGAMGGAVAQPSAQEPAVRGRKLTTVRSPLSTAEPLNPWEHVTTYNNFYEFGTRKSDPARNALKFRPRQPWTIAIDGECTKKGPLALEDILKGETLEDRVYRHRCVEGWSMVIPWVGFPLRTCSNDASQRRKRSLLNSPRSTTLARCPGSAATFSSGHTSKDSAWTKRSIR